MNGKTKKGRGIPARGGRGRMMERPPIYDGAYGNRLLQTMGSLVGYNMQVQTKNKEIYEGIFSSMSAKFEVVLELPHTINIGLDSSLIINPDVSKKKMIFSRDDIVTLKSVAVDVDFASKDSFAVDSAISNKINGQMKGRTLEPWENDEETTEKFDLEDNENGWDATDMFRRNEEIYGVQTTYKPDMEGYTTPLPKRDTKEWKEHEVQAQKIANEIEHSATTLTRAELENGQSEEDRFSAVSRIDHKYNMPPKRKTYASSNKISPRMPHNTSQGGNTTYRYNHSPPRASGSYSQSQPSGGMSSYSHQRQEPARNPPAPLVVNEVDATRGDKPKSEDFNVKQEAPKEQRRPRFKEEQIGELKEFGKSFNLNEAAEAKNTQINANVAKIVPPPRPVTMPAMQQHPEQTPSPVKPGQNLPQNDSAEEEQAAPPAKVLPNEEKKSPVIKPTSGLNPDAKVFTPRSAATPPPAPAQQMIGVHPQMLASGGAVNFQPNLLSTTYVIPQIQNNALARNMPKRGAVLGSHQRADYSSPMQVANATGTPLLSQGPIANMPSVQLSQGMMAQNQYQHHYPFVMRYPSPVPATMVTAMMPTPGVYPQADMSQGPHLHQQMFMSPGVMHHPAAQLAAAQHPPQAHTPQSHNTGPLPTHGIQPAQPPTPGPSPSQSGLYGGPISSLGGQATLAGHLPPHAHPAQAGPHNSQYGSHGAVPAHPQTALLMIPPQMQSPHMLAQAANTPHSGAGQIPATMPQYSTSSVVHYNHGPPVNYIPGHNNQVPLVHHNQ